MRQGTVNHRRITSIVKSVIDYEVYKANELQWQLKHEPDSEFTASLKEKGVMPGIEFESADGIKREYVTINKEFLSLVGYDDNMKGFLADYFGTDYKPKDGEPLKYRYINGYLINPTRLE